MRLTHFGHAAVLVETDDGATALIDPGTYSAGFESLCNLNLILVTHAHPDHVDAERLAALRAANPEAILASNAEGLAAAGAAPGPEANPRDRLVSDGTPFEAAGVRIQPTPSAHAPIHPSLPSLANTGFLLEERVWHPGDAFDAKPPVVDILLLPVGGPWMKLSEAIEFARVVEPRIVVPIHQAGLADIHRQLHYQLIRNLVPAELVVLPEGTPQDV
ncbi:MBL fold metallo-hydrolase [Microbacterium insulae]|uniref:MBL fold metallo-hydrolase n=1 Tax=Microbacterium insulae TaxID=483014 RepID=A0ABW3AHW9_9MICO